MQKSTSFLQDRRHAETPAVRHAFTAIGAILPAVVGDLINLPGLERSYALERCALEVTHRTAYACLSCRQFLANGVQLTFHLEAGGSHVVVRQCLEHGWEPL